MKAAAGILLACVACVIAAQGQKYTLPPYDATSLKRPTNYEPLYAETHIDDWSPFKEPANYKLVASALESAIKAEVGEGREASA